LYDIPFDDIGGGHVGIGGFHDQGFPGIVGFGGEGVSSQIELSFNFCRVSFGEMFLLSSK
jgi:hypothetical protein